MSFSPQVLPWFQGQTAPLYLAPMAGVTDLAFRTICKELGADVMVTEFVSAEGIIRQDQRTRKYTEFTNQQRPVGVQLFGADGQRMGVAAQKIISWKKPDFIDINFGCPVNKVVSKNGGSSLLKDEELLSQVTSQVVQAVGSEVAVTAKIRIGWDQQSINAVRICQILEEAGVSAIAIHGRTRSQGYRGEADWEVINEAAQCVGVPVIGNGDLSSAQLIKERLETTAISGVMIGRSAMQNPWIFQETQHLLKTGERLPPPSIKQRWELILKHCRLAVNSNRYGGQERATMMAMRSKLMAYTKGFPAAKPLRQRLTTVESIMEMEEIASHYLSQPLIEPELGRSSERE